MPPNRKIFLFPVLAVAGTLIACLLYLHLKEPKTSRKAVAPLKPRTGPTSAVSRAPSQKNGSKIHGTPAPESAKPEEGAKEKSEVEKKLDAVKGRVSALLAELSALSSAKQDPRDAIARLVEALKELHAAGGHLEDDWARQILALERGTFLALADALHETALHEMMAESAVLLAMRYEKGADDDVARRLKERIQTRMLWIASAGGTPFDRALAVEAVNRYLWSFREDAAVIREVMEKLLDASPEVRGPVVITLGNTRNPVALAEIKRILANDPDPQVRSFAIWALGNFPREQVEDIFPTLREQLAKGDINAALSLAKFGERDAAPFLIESLAHYADDQYEGTLGSAALGKLDVGGDAQMIGKVRSLLSDTNPKVRYNAAYILAMWGDASMAEVLKQAQADPALAPEGRLDVATAIALAKLGDASVRPKLERWAASGNPGRATAAREALEKIKGK